MSMAAICQKYTIYNRLIYNINEIYNEINKLKAEISLIRRDMDLLGFDKFDMISQETPREQQKEAIIE